VDEVWLDANRTTSGGRDLAATGQQLARLRASAGAEVESLSATRPWGGDDIGSAFDRNYRPVEEQLLQAWEAIGRHVEGLGDAVLQSVHDLLRSDDDAADRVHHAYGKRP
jgi:hypothetical protein